MRLGEALTAASEQNTADEPASNVAPPYVAPVSDASVL